MIFFDTETCGLHGVAVLIQWARDDGEIHLFEPWSNPICDTLKLIEMFCEEGVVGFNLAFDWFHLTKLYNLFLKFPDHMAYPIDNVQELAELEKDARDGLCIKPKECFDLMLHARKGPYQSTMDRNDIRIKRIPTPLAWKLAEELGRRIPFNSIYFARKKDKRERWKVYDIHNDLGDIDPNFKDVVLKFAPSSALKALASDALGLNESVIRFAEVNCDAAVVDCGWAPFAEAIGSPKDWKGTWPDVLELHHGHWAYNSLARRYATDDVVYTRNLFKHFSGLEAGFSESQAREYALGDDWFNDIEPLEMSDDDSVLACAVGAIRWKGFKIDVEKLENLKLAAQKRIGKHKSLATAPHVARRYLEQHMDETEKLVIQNSTKKQILEEVSRWEEGTHPAAVAAKEILDARKAKKKIEVIDKLLQAGRFHASFKVIGTLSSRMSGSDGLNPQGIGHETEFRECFPLAWDDFQLCGGDFESFEVTLADAEYNDPELRKDLESGKKIHALLGEHFFPNDDYDTITASKGTDDDKYLRSKQGVFALIYGGEGFTLSNRVGIDEENAEDAYQKIIRKYKQIGVARKKVFDAFCSMRQPGGIGTKVEWHEPADYVESMLGFRRYFTLENRICSALFKLAEDPPKDWVNLKIKVVRRERQQSASGAARSALFAAAFAIQASNMRAAANHRIQSTGAQITKKMERNIWDIQPAGVHEWLVLPMNVHDEVISPTVPGKVDVINQTVKETVESFRPIVPLIGIDWSSKLRSWADK